MRTLLYAIIGVVLTGFAFPVAQKCEMVLLKEEQEMIDSVEVRFNYYREIDVLSSECDYALHENSHNTVPLPGASKLIIVYLEKNIHNDGLSYHLLKAAEKKDEDYGVKAVFVYEVKSGFNKLYKDRAGIRQVLK